MYASFFRIVIEDRSSFKYCCFIGFQKNQKQKERKKLLSFYLELSFLIWCCRFNKLLSVFNRHCRFIFVVGQRLCYPLILRTSFCLLVLLISRRFLYVIRPPAPTFPVHPLKRMILSLSDSSKTLTRSKERSNNGGCNLSLYIRRA